jgi:hypothetical protein
MRYLFILSLIVVCASGLFALESWEADMNKDGKPDKWVRIESDNRIVITADQNFDGEIDYRGEFTKEWKPIFEEFDDNYDKVMDTFYYYDKGALVREEIDSNNDGKIDIWVYMYSSVYIAKYAADTDFDGKIDKVIDYTKNK